MATVKVKRAIALGLGLVAVSTLPVTITSRGMRPSIGSILVTPETTPESHYELLTGLRNGVVTILKKVAVIVPVPEVEAPGEPSE